MSSESVNRLLVTWKLFKTVLALLSRSITHPFNSSRAPSYKQDVFYAALRTFLGSVAVEEIQYLYKTTEEEYVRGCKARSVEARTTDLGDGAKLHWMGDQSAEYILLFFHGGGFVSHAVEGHIKYLFGLQNALSAAGLEIAIIAADYTLSPEVVFPEQLKQAVSMLDHVLINLKRSPSKIIVAGDSAGGNLTTELLLHLARPRPGTRPIALEEPLKAAILISPWASFDYSTPAYVNNAQTDYLVANATKRAEAAFIGPGGKHDAYSEPARADAKWWSEVASNVVNHVLVTGGGGEILLDGIRQLAANARAGFEMVPDGASRFQYQEVPRDAHEIMIAEKTIGVRRRSVAGRQIENWISSKI